MTYLPKRPMIICCALATLGLSSCGLVRSAIQIPVRTIQGVGRTAGVGLEVSETETSSDDHKKISPDCR